MMYFSTLYDSNYISKGIALYLSIESHTKDFAMYVMAMDRKCHQTLSAIGFDRLVVECIEDIDDPGLSEAKNNRSRAEYCWTCGPYITDYFLHKYELPNIVYLDSDLMFFCSPQIVIDEVEKNNASIGLAPHFTKYPLFGKYCVQFVYFKNDKDGAGCLRWWRDCCLEWCYCKMEDGKYADQKYLDYFADHFGNVYVIENRGVGIAFWNMDDYSIAESQVCYNGKKWPVVFFHYSGFSILLKEGVLTLKHTMYLTKSIRSEIVLPYTDLLRKAYEKYLYTHISSIVVTPVSPFINCIKRVVHSLRKIFPVDWAVASVMIFKYREKRIPYNEPNKQ